MTRREFNKVLAAAAAGLVTGGALAGCKSTPEDEGGGDKHICKGQNACKGKGWKEMTEAECDAAKKAMSGK